LSDDAGEHRSTVVAACLACVGKSPARCPSEPPSSPAASSHLTSILDRGCPGFSRKELSTSTVLLISSPAPLRPPSPTAFPGPLCRHIHGRATFTALEVLLSRPTTPGTPLPTSLALIGSLPSVARGFQEPSWGHAQIFHTVPSANTLVRWVNENAFAPIVRARPCPTFGRPVRPWGCPHSTTARYFSAYPSDSGSLRTPCPPKHVDRWLQVRLACFRLSPSCPKRRLHTFLSLRPARHYPRFWIQRPSSERRRDFNPPDLGAAQRTLWAGPTSSRDAVSSGYPLLAAPAGDRSGGCGWTSQVPARSLCT
jgi:hypothetical protein